MYGRGYGGYSGRGYNTPGRGYQGRGWGGYQHLGYSGQSNKVYDDGKKSKITDANNRLLLMNKKWYDKHLMIPVPAVDNDNYASEPAQIRQQVWTKVIQELESHDLKASEQLGFLIQFFGFEVEREAKKQLTDDIASPTTNFYRWNYQSLHSSNLAIINIPAAGYDNNVARLARYANFELTLSPQRSYVAQANLVQPDLLPDQEILRVYVRLPTASDAAGQEAVHGSITNANYQSFHAIHLATQQAGTTITIGVTDPNTNAFDSATYNEKIKQLRAKIMYILFKVQNETPFVGTTSQRSLETRLRDCTQGSRAVNAYMNEFKALLAEAQDVDKVGGNYRFNAVDLAFQGLDEMIRDYLRDQLGYVTPAIQIMPQIAAQVQGITILVTQAQAAERALANMSKSVSRINANLSNSARRPVKRPATGNAAVLMAQAQPAFDPLGAFDVSNIYGGTDPSTATPVYAAPPTYESPFFQGLPHDDMKPPYQEQTDAALLSQTQTDANDQAALEVHNEEVKCLISKAWTAAADDVANCFQSLSILEETEEHVQVLVSPMELATRKASGMNAPSKCWGCGDIEKYKDNCLHHFSKCPHKSDPDVMTNGTNKILEFREKMRTRNSERGTLQQYRSPRQGATNWAQAGHPSAKCLKLTATINNPETQPDIRRTSYVNLAKELANHGKTATPAAAAAKGKKDSSPGEDGGFKILMLIPFLTIPILQTVYRPEALPINLSKELPHAKIPIGDDEESHYEIWCCLDSGAGLNLGHLEFFTKLAREYPELVESFKKWKDCTSMEKLSIGGVTAASSTAITHVIYLKTPYFQGGKRNLLAFGLAKDVQCTAIIGTPFFQAAGCSLNYANDTFYVRNFDRSFDIVFYEPGLRDVPDKDQLALRK